MSRLYKGRWYFVTWYDFQISLDGSPADGEGALRRFVGEFWGWKRRRVNGKVWSAAVFAVFGEEGEDRSQSGWFACPKGAFSAEELTHEQVVRQSRRKGSGVGGELRGSQGSTRKPVVDDGGGRAGNPHPGG